MVRDAPDALDAQLGRQSDRMRRHLLARIKVDEGRQLGKLLTKIVSDRPMADLAHVLLVDGIDGDLCRAIPIDTRREQHRGRIIRPAELEARAVRGGKVVNGDFRVRNEVLSC